MVPSASTVSQRRESNEDGDHGVVGQRSPGMRGGCEIPVPVATVLPPNTPLLGAGGAHLLAACPVPLPARPSEGSSGSREGSGVQLHTPALLHRCLLRSRPALILPQSQSLGQHSTLCTGWEAAQSRTTLSPPPSQLCQSPPLRDLHQALAEGCGSVASLAPNPAPSLDPRPEGIWATSLAPAEDRRLNPAEMPSPLAAFAATASHPTARCRATLPALHSITQGASSQPHRVNPRASLCPGCPRPGTCPASSGITWQCLCCQRCGLPRRGIGDGACPSPLRDCYLSGQGVKSPKPHHFPVQGFVLTAAFGKWLTSSAISGLVLIRGCFGAGAVVVPTGGFCSIPVPQAIRDIGRLHFLSPAAAQAASFSWHPRAPQSTLGPVLRQSQSRAIPQPWGYPPTHPACPEGLQV